MLAACGGDGGGGGAGGSAGTTCVVEDIPGEPDLLGQAATYATAVSPGDTVTVTVPVDADTRHLRALLFSGSVTAPRLAGEAWLNIATPATQAVTLNVPVTATVAGDYHVGVVACSDEEACASRGAGVGVAYGALTEGDTSLTRYVFYDGAIASASETTCLTAGSVNVAPGNTVGLIGELDPTFSDRGVVQIDFGGDEYAAAAFVQPDGKVIVLGDDGADIIVVRLNVDGTMDEDFGVAGIARIDIDGGNDRASDMAIDSHGRILVAGTNTPRSFVIRLFSDGTRDTSFGASGIALTPLATRSTYVHAIALDHSDRIVVGGSVLGVSLEVDLFVARFLTDGAVDTDFRSIGYAIRDVNFPSVNASIEEILDMAVDASDGIVFAGAANIDNAALASADHLVGRFDSTGVPDGGFGSTGPVIPCEITLPCGLLFDYTAPADGWFGVTLDEEGRILVTGAFDGAISLARWDGAGLADPSFTSSTTTVATLDQGSDVLRLPEGKILIGGSTMSPWIGLGGFRVLNYLGDFGLLRYTDTGALDTGFGSSGSGTVVSDVTGQPEQLVRLARRGGDGTVIAVGNTYNGTDRDILITRYR